MSPHDSFAASGNSPSPKKKTKWDFRVEYHGSICLLVLLSGPGRAWVNKNIGDEKLHKSGVGIEHWAGASPAEKAAYAEQAALERNKWLRTGASPLELKAEARYETQAQVAASQQAQADASLQAQKQRDQNVGYKPLPAHIDRKALINASKDELRKWSRLYGQFQTTPPFGASSKGDSQ